MITSNKNIYNLANDELNSDNFKNLMQLYLSDSKEEELYFHISSFNKENYSYFEISLTILLTYNEKTGHYCIGRKRKHELEFGFPIEYLKIGKPIDISQMSTNELNLEDKILRKEGANFVKNNVDDLTEKIILYLESAIKLRYKKNINACMN